jgi:hypothetical protein
MLNPEWRMMQAGPVVNTGPHPKATQRRAGVRRLLCILAANDSITPWDATSSHGRAYANSRRYSAA